MPRVERHALVGAPPEQVFDFVADPANALRWMHNFTRFDPIEPSVVGVGSRVNAGGLVMGLPIATTLEIIAFDRPHLLASRTSGRLKTESSWHFAAENGGTRVTFVGEYDVPGALLRMIGSSIVQRELETNAEKSLDKLRAALEGGAV